MLVLGAPSFAPFGASIRLRSREGRQFLPGCPRGWFVADSGT